MLQNIERRRLGLNFTSTSTADILVWSPLAENIFIVINKENLVSLNKGDFGYWEANSLDINEGDNYQIMVDQKCFPDPSSLYQPHGVHGISEAYNLHNYHWNDKEWKGISTNDLIIYELHTGTFTQTGDFDGISGKLKYLKDLGINAIEIMPVAQFPGTRNWGYDGVFPFAVQNSYGGPKGLQNLVDACHQQGIAVILDVVFNHVGSEGNYLTQFGPYFTGKYKTPWGNAINFDDEWCDGVREYYIENALMWLRDFHIDGLRLDAVHAIKDFSAKHILQELKEYVTTLNDLTGKRHFLIAESDLNDVRYINSSEKGGYGIDIQWCDEFHHAIHALVTKEKNGYYSDFGDNVWDLVKSFNEAYVYDGIYSPYRKKRFGSKTKDLSGYKFVVFTQNHDQIGNRMLGERLSTLVDYETLKLIAGAMLLSPFTPLLFMGEEYGETNPFLYFTSHEDENLIRLVSEGRKNEFTHFMDGGDVPDPQSLETFNRSKLQWDNQIEQQLRLFEYYKELIRLRKHHPVLKNTNRQGVEANVINNKNIIVLRRQYLENMIICIMNFEADDVTIDLPAVNNSLYMLMDSAEENWNNTQTKPWEERIKIKAKSILVFSNVKV